jgi:hypothetical protein
VAQSKTSPIASLVESLGNKASGITALVENLGNYFIGQKPRELLHWSKTSGINRELLH